MSSSNAALSTFESLKNVQAFVPRMASDAQQHNIHHAALAVNHF